MAKQSPKGGKHGQHRKTRGGTSGTSMTSDPSQASLAARSAQAPRAVADATGEEAGMRGASPLGQPAHATASQASAPPQASREQADWQTGTPAGPGSDTPLAAGGGGGEQIPWRSQSEPNPEVGREPADWSDRPERPWAAPGPDEATTGT